MKLSRGPRILLALSSGVLLALAFPLYNVPLVGWAAPALLILAVLGEGPRFGFIAGMVQGLVCYGISLPWIYTVLRQYGPLPVGLAALLFFLAICVPSIFHAAFGALIAWISRVCVDRACLAAPLAWVALEYAQTVVPALGFPWNLLGYVAARSLPLVQLAAVTGIWGLSLLVAAYSALVAWVIACRAAGHKTRCLWLAGVSAVLVLATIVGPRLVPRASADHVAHLVQTNFPVALNYPSDWMQAHAADMDQLEKISIEAAQKEPGPVVWPEVPAPFSLQDADFYARALRIARGAGHGFLVGVLNFKRLDNGQTGASNSAALLGPDGSQEFLYDKIHLVPFSEYIPLRKWLFFAQDLTGIVGDFQRGTQYKVGSIGGGPASVYICYEAIFPNEVRRFTQGGALLFINISDDGWFGGSGAPAQHLAMARVRAVENRRWLLRDTNDGVTVSVDPYGRMVARLPANTRGELDAPYAFRSDMTVYARWGDWLPWLCVLGALVLVYLVARDAIARAKSSPSE